MVAQSVGANWFVKTMKFWLSLEHGKVESGIAPEVLVSFIGLISYSKN